MSDTGETAHSIVDAFRAAWSRDAEAGRIRPLREYLAEFEGAEHDIAREYFRLGQASSTFAPTSSLDLADLNKIAHYELVKRLGKGGQAVVYLAHDTRLNRQVALKISHLDVGAHDRDIKRFKREAEITSRLVDHRICPVYESGVAGRHHYIAMQYIEGETLAAILAARRERHVPDWIGLESESTAVVVPRDDVQLSPKELEKMLVIVEEVARALHRAHEAGVVHRDVKPANIMVTKTGEPVLLDFGLAESPLDSATNLDVVGHPAGTLPYMAPEQLLMGLVKIDRRADVYSLGATLYEALTLHRPITGEDRQDLSHAIAIRPPVNPLTYNPAISRDLRTILEKCLEKDRERRFATALDLANDLRRVLEHRPILARPAGPVIRMTRWSQRNRGLSASLLAVVVLLLVTPTLLYLQQVSLNEKIKQERAEARSQALENRRLADVLETEALIEEEDELYPIAPALEARMRDWLGRASALLARVRSDAVVRDKIGAQLEELEAAYEARVELADKAADLIRLSNTDRADIWTKACESVASLEAYDGIELTPQVGLVPFRRDPGSGLWEFWHLLSGELPDVDPEIEDLVPEAGWPILLVLVPGGTLRMTDRESGATHEKAVPAFFIGKHEVTQAQWRRIMANDPSHYSALNVGFLSKALLDEVVPDDLHPVETITWEEAWRFTTRSDLVLPTEIQWEFACRGGGSSRFWWGHSVAEAREAENLFDESALRVLGGSPQGGHDDGQPVHARIGSFDPNGYGLHDMQGNVSEWCGTIFRHDVADIPLEPERAAIPGVTDFRAALRGAAWNIRIPDYCESSFRIDRHAKSPNMTIGLRVARDLRAEE